MKQCYLVSCTGTVIISWESQILSHIPKERRLKYIEENSPRLRELYCSEVCPVARFNKKYQTKQVFPEQPSRTFAFESVYPFEGGIEYGR